MRYAVTLVALVAGACAPQQQQMDPLTYSHEVYIGCLRGHPPEECETQRAAFEANRAYADSVSRRMASTPQRPPLVLQQYTPPAPVQQRQPLTCTTNSGVTTCF